MSSSSEKADQMALPILPQDIIHSIFSRLPVKSLMRFRCVSTPFNSLVHDPLFIKLHLHRALENLDRRRVLVCTDPPQYILSEYGVQSSSTKTATMPEDPGPSFIDSFYGDWLVPFSLCSNGCLLVDMDGNEVLIYDSKRMTFRKIELGENRDMFLVQEFVESLVSPYGA